MLLKVRIIRQGQAISTYEVEIPETIWQLQGEYILLKRYEVQRELLDTHIP